MAKKQSLEKKKAMKAQSLQRKADREREENLILSKCLSFLAVLAVCEIYFLLCYRFFVQSPAKIVVTMTHVIGVVSWVGLAALVVGAVLAVKFRQKKHGQWWLWLAVLGAVLFLGGRLMLTIYPAGTTAMCVITPLLALAGFVYYLYQREFFCAGLGLGLAAAGGWLAHRAATSSTWGTKYIAVEVVVLILVLALLAFSIAVGRNGGVWGKGEKAITLFSGTTQYPVAYAALGFAALCVAVSLFLPALGLYLMWLSIALLFVLAVYYTIHMM